MTGPKWILAAIGVLCLWILISTARDFRRGFARRRDGKAYLRADNPNKFWETVILNVAVSTLILAGAIGAIFFGLPMRR
jgi:hypothetical protein